MGVGVDVVITPFFPLALDFFAGGCCGGGGGGIGFGFSGAGCTTGDVAASAVTFGNIACTCVDSAAIWSLSSFIISSPVSGAFFSEGFGEGNPETVGSWGGGRRAVRFSRLGRLRPLLRLILKFSPSSSLFLLSLSHMSRRVVLLPAARMLQLVASRSPRLVSAFRAGSGMISVARVKIS